MSNNESSVTFILIDIKRAMQWPFLIQYDS